jgi:hypothetical protein
MQKHTDIQWLRGIRTLEVAISHSDLIWKLFGALHLCSIADYLLRIEALFRHTPASARQTRLRCRTSSNPTTPKRA